MNVACGDWTCKEKGRDWENLLLSGAVMYHVHPGLVYRGEVKEVVGAAGIIIGVWVAGAKTWQPGRHHGSRMEYLPWLISCELLRLDSEMWGEHLTSQLPWAAAWLLVTCGSPVYLVVAEFSTCVLWPLMILG